MFHFTINVFPLLMIIGTVISFTMFMILFKKSVSYISVDYKTNRVLVVTMSLIVFIVATMGFLYFGTKSFVIDIDEQNEFAFVYGLEGNMQKISQESLYNGFIHNVRKVSFPKEIEKEINLHENYKIKAKLFLSYEIEFDALKKYVLSPKDKSLTSPFENMVEAKINKSINNVIKEAKYTPDTFNQHGFVHRIETKVNQELKDIGIKVKVLTEFYRIVE